MEMLAREEAVRARRAEKDKPDAEKKKPAKKD
jgi:hypothetical protein